MLTPDRSKWRNEETTMRHTRTPRDAHTPRNALLNKPLTLGHRRSAKQAMYDDRDYPIAFNPRQLARNWRSKPVTLPKLPWDKDDADA
jgi:hypothetical protein